jgi:hypothetical protein
LRLASELRLEMNWEIIIYLALRLKVISCRVARLREQKRIARTGTTPFQRITSNDSITVLWSYSHSFPWLKLLEIVGDMKVRGFEREL